MNDIEESAKSYLDDLESGFEPSAYCPLYEQFKKVMSENEEVHGLDFDGMLQVVVQRGVQDFAAAVKNGFY